MWMLLLTQNGETPDTGHVTEFTNTQLGFLTDWQWKNDIFCVFNIPHEIWYKGKIPLPCVYYFFYVWSIPKEVHDSLVKLVPKYSLNKLLLIMLPFINFHNIWPYRVKAFWISQTVVHLHPRSWRIILHPCLGLWNTCPRNCNIRTEN